MLLTVLLPAFASPSNSTSSVSHEETMLDDLGDKIARSEERRVGKECYS